MTLSFCEEVGDKDKNVWMDLRVIYWEGKKEVGGGADQGSQLSVLSLLLELHHLWPPGGSKYLDLGNIMNVIYICWALLTNSLA